MFLDYLKLQGQKVLDKYSPENNKLGRINPHNVFWMVASIAVFYYTDFYIALKIDPNIKRYKTFSQILCFKIWEGEIMVPLWAKSTKNHCGGVYF